MSSSTSSLSKADQLQLKKLLDKAGGVEQLTQSILQLDLTDEKTIYGYGYMRVSDPKLEHPETLKIQEKIIREYGKSVHICILEIYKDTDFSGALPLEDRPALKNLLWNLHPGQCIVGAASDRLFRDGNECKRLKSFIKPKSCIMMVPDYIPDVGGR